MGFEKQLKVLHELARYIEQQQLSIGSSGFLLLRRYHRILQHSSQPQVQKINREFAKVKHLDRQFQIYMMHLERFRGQATKEYDFWVQHGDHAQKKQTFPLICLLDSVRSAHNVGAMFRNAECFGVQELVLTGLSPTPDHPQVKKTSMGTTGKVPWGYHEDAVQVVAKLRNEGYTIWALETSRQATELAAIREVPDKLVVLFGHEQFGLSLALLESSDGLFCIPMFGQKNSLNVGVAQAIALYEITQHYGGN